jgi:transposase-like protein
MKRTKRRNRKFTDKQKRKFVAYGETHGVNELRRVHGIYTNSFYQWRDKFAVTEGPSLNGHPVEIEQVATAWAEKEIAQIRKLKDQKVAEWVERETAQA